MVKINVNKLDPTEQAQLLESLLSSGAMANLVEAKQDRAELTMAGEYVEQANEFVENMGKIYGITTGFDPFDQLTMGMHGGDLVVIGGQTSHGKSLLANNIAFTMAKQGRPVLFATLEMTKIMTTARFLQLAKADGVKVEDLPIYYQLASELNYGDIGMLIGNAKKYGCELAIIDHLHFFPRGQGENVRNEISRITKHMKGQAVEHDIPVLLLSHVKRLEDKKKKPSLSDLKESGSIEQDADIVIMIWRDLSEDSLDTNYTELSVLKNRNKGFPKERVKQLYQVGAKLSTMATKDIPFLA